MSSATLDRAEYMAFNEAMLRSTVGIAVKQNSVVGTGTLVSCGLQKFVLTANHVIKEADLLEARFFVPPRTPLKEHSMRSGLPEGFDLPFAGEHLSVGDVVLVDEQNDLAAIPLKSTALIRDYMTFVPIETCVENIDDDASVLVLGFPVDNSVNYHGQGSYPGTPKVLGLTSNHMKYFNKIQSQYVLHSHFDKDRHFVTEYTAIEEGITPPGFSGAAAWCSGSPTAGLWFPKPILAGVYTCWHKKTARQPHLLQAANGSSVKKLFESQS